MPEPNARLGILPLAVGTPTALAGSLFWLGALGWFGRLPGDLRIQRGHSTIFAPLTSMRLASAALGLLLWLVRQWQ